MDRRVALFYDGEKLALYHVLIMTMKCPIEHMHPFMFKKHRNYEYVLLVLTIGATRIYKNTTKAIQILELYTQKDVGEEKLKT